MSGDSNENFPRGGVLNKTFTGAVKRKTEDFLFDPEKECSILKKRRKDLQQVNIITSNSWQTSLPHSTLTYNKMQEGMVVLTCVRRISNVVIQVELPGLTFANVGVNQISDLFTKHLTANLKTGAEEDFVNNLKNIIKIGELMPAKIIAIRNSHKGFDVQASVNPRDINFNRKHNSFQKGAIIWTNVVSELDHGYELTAGVVNCRIFLPFKNIDEGSKYELGKPLYCVIHKIENSASATTLTVSAKQEHTRSIYAKEHFSLDDLIPGTKVKFIVEAIFSHGIRGRILENCVGYLDETQMFSKISKDSLREGSFIETVVLYVEPLSKVTYLTLRDLQILSPPDYKMGKIMSATILNAHNGLYLQLEKNKIGFVTNKRLLKTLPSEAQVKIVDSVKKKYPVGSRHDCRILDYNYMQELYICTLEKHLIKEKIFSVKDLKIGQLVTVKIDKILPNGLIVKVGHVQGFVPNLHLSNLNYSESVKSKYTENMCVNARVLNITSEDNVIFTLKQALLDSNEENCLTEATKAVSGSQYTGFVVQTKISGALIAFYGGVTGWISNKTLNADNSGRYVDPREYFFVGQVVTVWVLGLNSNKLQVSLTCPSKDYRKLSVGQLLNGTVTEIQEENILVHIGQENIEARIPLAHLSSNLSLCPVVSSALTLGHQIPLICVRNTGALPVVSRREFVSYKKHSCKIPKFRDIKKHMSLRCSVEGKSSAGIYVSTLVADYHENIFIPNENIDYSEELLPVLENQQLVTTKVLNVDYNSKTVELGIASSPSREIKDTITPLIDTIEELEYITNLHIQKRSKLTSYKIGERVECRIETIDVDGSCSVKLPNGINGVISANLCPANYKSGMEVEGVVLDYNFVDNCIELCAKNNVIQKINKDQNGLISASFYSNSTAKVVLLTKFYALGILNGDIFNRQLIYLPLSFDYTENVKKFSKEKLKVVVIGKVCSKIIGMPKKLYLSLQKTFGKRDVLNKNKSKVEKTINCKSTMSCPEFEQSSYEENANTLKSTDRLVLDENLLVQKPILSDTCSFYQSESHQESEIYSSSEEEEEQDKSQSKTNKKLSAVERAELSKREEEKVAIVEKELTVSALTPQNAEQFDRLLLANPNSSQLWLQYISMHVAAADLERARAVGKRAIETINMTADKEKFNVWVALLNLENMYGTKESFEKVAAEALRYNDSLEMYLSIIKMLASASKLIEMEEKIKKVRSKMKHSPRMWLELGRNYYTLQKFEEARKVREDALKSILDNKKQFDLIVQFGLMEFQLGDVDQAVVNFETLVDTYPKKGNIWIIYIDQLIKRNRIELARKVLENAVRQKFGIKMMKTLYQKFISFEEKYGSLETIRFVKNRVKEYIKTVGLQNLT